MQKARGFFPKWREEKKRGAKLQVWVQTLDEQVKCRATEIADRCARCRKIGHWAPECKEKQ